MKCRSDGNRLRSKYKASGPTPAKSIIHSSYQENQLKEILSNNQMRVAKAAGFKVPASFTKKATQVIE